MSEALHVVAVHKDPKMWISLGPMGHPDFSEYSFYEVGRTDPLSVGRFIVFLEALLELNHRSLMHEEGNLLLEGSPGYANAAVARQFVEPNSVCKTWRRTLVGMALIFSMFSPIAP